VLSLFPTGLAAVRSLGRAGVSVRGFDSDRAMPGFASRYCEASLCPDPDRDPERLVEFLLASAPGGDPPPVLFPASDAFVLFVSRHRGRLGTAYAFALPDEEVVEAVVNKRLQYDLAQRAGVPYPATAYPESAEEVDAVAGTLEYPVIVKPYYGHLWRQTFGGEHKGFKVTAPDELREVFGRVLPKKIPALVQSVVPGPNTSHYKLCAYVRADGTPSVPFALRKVRQYPPEFGVGTLVESVHDTEVTELGLRFLEKIGYRGIGSIEFKRDARDGSLKLIELNPRLWQQNSLATACGLNYPLVQVLDLEGGPLPQDAGYPAGVRWLDAVADFQSFWAQRKATGAGVASWLASLRGVRAFATFAWDDPRPYLRENGYGLRYARLPLYLYRRRREAA
jgi:D-aspartate ligase